MRHYRLLLIPSLAALALSACTTQEPVDSAVNGDEAIVEAPTEQAPVKIVRSYLRGHLGKVDMARIADDKTVTLRDSRAAQYADVTLPALQTHIEVHLGATGSESFVASQFRQKTTGETFMRFDQQINGLPVAGAQLAVAVDADGIVTRVNGEFAPDHGVIERPALDANVAMDLALADADLTPDLFIDDTQLTYVVGRDDQVVLAWAQTIEYTDAMGPQRDVLFADAVTGEVVTRHPQFYYARSLRTYDCNNGTSCGSLTSSSSNAINTGDSAIDSAHNYAIATYDYFSANHNRDSLDDNGMTLRSRVHYSNNYNNAFWDGSQMTYGDGDGTTFKPLSEDADVVAHELTHGVTTNSSNLVYQNESGALNEAMSDIFGAMVDRQEGATGADIWHVGEDIYTPNTSGDGGIRDMACPSCAGDYDYYPTRYTGSQDNGGVHWNSGIANLAFKLLVTGGTHPQGSTSINVPAIGFDAAADIFYAANNTCLTSSSNFEAARNCTAGATSGATQDAVHAAWDAVGVPGGPNEPPPPDDPPPGSQCSDTNIWTATISSGAVVTPNCSASGTFNAVLECTTGSGSTDLDLFLQKQSNGWGGLTWSNVATSGAATCEEAISGYNGSSGTYRWNVDHYSGGTAVIRLCTNKC